jgi:hypothetical protein
MHLIRVSKMVVAQQSSSVIDLSQKRIKSEENYRGSDAAKAFSIVANAQKAERPVRIWCTPAVAPLLTGAQPVPPTGCAGQLRSRRSLGRRVQLRAATLVLPENRS